MGLLSVGNIISKTLKGMGFYVNSDREYPSLIKGGHSYVQIDFSQDPIHSLSTQVDVGIALDRAGLLESLNVVKEGGTLVHGFERHHLISDLEKRAKKRKIQLMYLPARQIAYSLGGNEIMVNMVLLGLLWRVLGFELNGLEKEITRQFASKPKLLEIDLKCVKAGYNKEGVFPVETLHCNVPTGKTPKTILVNGNLAIALGALHAGVRAYYAYPMSPASSILTYMSEFANEAGILVKQAEDEITAAQMALGSMFMGTRAMTATSGGGFDLMTETVSLAGMTETPLIIVIAQRPGPATGLPTWTAQADLNMAIHSGHGEFARVVVAVSDPLSCFELTQHALNLAEEFQVPVILLTEKTIAETQVTVPMFEQGKIRIRRGLVTGHEALKNLKPSDRFKLTESGLSKRWIPGSSHVHYYGNGDEHNEDGTLTEEAEPCKAMYAKRMRKLTLIEESLPDAEILGLEKKADISFIGWGSSKNAILDTINNLEDKGIKVNYLHYSYVWPLKVDKVKAFFKNNKNVHLIEGNYQGQLGDMIEAKTGLKFKGRLLKYNGRPFYVEDVMQYIKNNTK